VERAVGQAVEGVAPTDEKQKQIPRLRIATLIGLRKALRWG